MNVGDIQNVTFEKAMRGYRAEDVDDFLAKMAQEFDALIEERDAALAERDSVLQLVDKEKSDSEQKLYILAEKIEQYRADEEHVKVALLNAQRLGESVVYEAKQKAEGIVYEAKTKATQMHEEMKRQQTSEEDRLVGMRNEVIKFRNEILDLYKQHIELLSHLPTLESKSGIMFSVGSEQASIAKQETQEKEDVFAEKPRRQPEIKETKEDTQFNDSDELIMPSEVKIESFENYQGIRFEE